MALIDCKDCSTKVSEFAAYCLQCGRPINGRAANSVRIRDVEIPFWSATAILFNFALALIPAGFLVGVVYTVIMAVLAALGTR